MHSVTPFLLPVVFALLLGGCGAGDVPPAPARTVLIQTAAPAQGENALYVGEIRARHEVELSFRVGGKIAARLVDNGNAILPGQALARLDPTDLELSAAAAKAQLASAETDVATSAAEKERYAGLLARRFVSQAAFDAKANALSAAQGRLEQARAQSKISGNQAHYGTLSSDFPAVVTAILAEAGQVVAPGQPVMRIARPEHLEVAIAVPESRLADIRRTDPITVRLWSHPEIAIKGEVRELSAAADPATRTYAARIRLLAPPGETKLGMTARVAFGAAASNQILVPLSAVLDLGQGPFVRIVTGGKVLSRPVRVDRFRDDGALIASGIAPGDAVVIAGAGQLVDGQVVETRTATPPERQR